MHKIMEKLVEIMILDQGRIGFSRSVYYEWVGNKEFNLKIINTYHFKIISNNCLGGIKSYLME